MSSTRKWVNRKRKREILGESWNRFESGDRKKERKKEKVF
jgi:hypothetical protein